MNQIHSDVTCHGIYKASDKVKILCLNVFNFQIFEFLWLKEKIVFLMFRLSVFLPTITKT